jgi:hypothetical protein
MKKRRRSGIAMAEEQSTAPQGVTGPDEKVSVSWLILQRLDDLKGQLAAIKQDLHEEIQTVKRDTNARIDDVKQDLDALKTSTDHRFDAVDRRFDTVDHRFDAVDHRFDAVDHRFNTLQRQWAWSIGLIAVMALGLLAKLLIPGA